MLLLTVLAACQCNDPTTSTTIDVDTGTDPYTKKYTTYEESGGSTGDTSVPAVCAATTACWRFELPAKKLGVPDLSGNDHLLTLGGAAMLVGPGPQLPGGVPNTGVLQLGGGDDVAFVDVTGTELATFTDGFTAEVLARSSEKELSPDIAGDRIRTALWLDDHRVSVRLIADEKGSVQIGARVNYAGDDPGACGVEALGALSDTLPNGACASVTYATETGELRVYVNAVEVARSNVAKGCSLPAAIGPTAKGSRLQVGGDDTVGDANADHGWRGQLDEVRITDRALTAKQLSCALAKSR